MITQDTYHFDIEAIPKKYKAGDPIYVQQRSIRPSSLEDLKKYGFELKSGTYRVKGYGKSMDSDNLEPNQRNL